MNWFDTHAHLFNSPLLEDIESYLTQATEAGVTGILTVGTDLQSSRVCVELANRYPSVWAAVGIHPNECAKAAE